MRRGIRDPIGRSVLICSLAAVACLVGQARAAPDAVPEDSPPVVGHAIVIEVWPTAASGALAEGDRLAEPGALPSGGHWLPKLDPASRERMLRSWDPTERSLRWSYVLWSAMDAYQTARRPDGYHEVNPLLASWAGKQPNALDAVLFKSAATYATLRLADRFTRTGKRRKTVLWLLNALQFSVVLHNERVTGGIVFP